MKFTIILMMMFAVAAGQEGNSNAKENMGILFSNYSTVMAVHKILISETKGNGLEADSVKAITKILNEVVTSYRTGRELVAGLDNEEIARLNRRLVGLASMLIGIRDVLAKHHYDLGHADNSVWLSTLKANHDIAY